MSAPMPGDSAAGPGAAVGEARLVALTRHLMFRHAFGMSDREREAQWKVAKKRPDVMRYWRGEAGGILAAVDAASRPAPEPGDGGGDARLRAEVERLRKIVDTAAAAPWAHMDEVSSELALPGLFGPMESVWGAITAARTAPEGERGRDFVLEHMLNATRRVQAVIDKLAAAERALGEARDVLRQAVEIARTQPFYPDTHTGTRQQWVKDRIAERIEALAAQLAGPARGQEGPAEPPVNAPASPLNASGPTVNAFGSAANPAEPGRAGVRRADVTEGGHDALR